MTSVVETAAQHFLNLYAEEIAQGETITPDVIYEWWGQTKDQYPDVEYGPIEEKIMELLPESQFHKWAAEINKDWIGGYNAKASSKNLLVSINGQIVAEVNDKLQVSGNDTDAIEQLTYMTNR